MLGSLIGLGLFVAALVLLPLLLLKLVFGVLFAVIALPFKLLGGLLKVAFGLVAGVLGVVVSGFGVVAMLAFGLLLLVALPLLPILLFAGFVWAVVKVLSPRPVTTV
jgi:hypothetical protein